LNQFIDDQQTWDTLEKTWKSLFDELKADPTEHFVLISIPLMPPNYLQSNLEKLLFKRFKVPAMHLAPAPVLACYSYGRYTGLVIDIGNSSAQVCPIVDGFLKEVAIRRAAHLGGEILTQRMYEFLKYTSIGKLPRLEALKVSQIIKDKYCFCSVGDYKVDEKDSKYKATHVLPNGESITVLKALANVGETYWDPKGVMGDLEETILSLQELIQQSIENSELDSRQELLSNILLSGGGTMMKGFVERLEIEVKKILPYAADYIHIFADKDRTHSVWRGGSVLAKLDSFQKNWTKLEEWAVDHED